MARIEQVELFFDDVAAGQSETKRAFTTVSKGEIQQYRISASSALITVDIVIDGIARRINFEGDNIPLYKEVNANSEISIKVSNNDSTAQDVFVMLLLQEF